MRRTALIVGGSRCATVAFVAESKPGAGCGNNPAGWLAGGLFASRRRDRGDNEQQRIWETSKNLPSGPTKSLSWPTAAGRARRERLASQNSPDRGKPAAR
jgi:hypothetical protein